MRKEDIKHLDLLAIFHFVVGGITGLFSLMPIAHVLLGLAIVSGKFFKENPDSPPPPAFMGWMFVLMGAFFIILGLALAISIIIAGLKLKKRQSRTFCMIIAGCECLFMPFGTILGIFTLIALNKDSIKSLFEEQMSQSDNQETFSSG